MSEENEVATEDVRSKSEPQSLMARHPNAAIFTVVFALLGFVIGLQMCH
jgi:hypothetical protein